MRVTHGLMILLLSALAVPAVHAVEPATLKRLTAGGTGDKLEAIHDIKPFRPLFGDSEEDRRKLQGFELRYPLRVHPVVRVHPVSGRKVLFVNPQFTIAIKDMDERESRALLDTLFHQALIPEYQYRLRWRPHTVAMWDNRSVNHARTDFPGDEVRLLRRYTISEAAA